MRVLLDTHAFLWWIADDPRLSSRARRTIADSSNDVYFSAASAWEIAIKARLGRLKVVGDDVERLVAEQVIDNGFQALSIHLNHALGTYSLPNHHRDPFDRLLLAQCAAEGLALVSADRRLAGYRVRIIW